MLNQELILPLILIAIGFSQFLLGNLQKGIFTKIFTWSISVCIIFLGIFFTAKALTKNLSRQLSKTNVGAEAQKRIYKKAELNKIFAEVQKAWKKSASQK